MQELLEKALYDIKIGIERISNTKEENKRQITYHSTCGKIWLLLNIDLITLDDALKLIDNATKAYNKPDCN
ncbi:MAG: hypothetical protein E7678_05170 [Ruminococcaceae bacterium]|nr:hypothetical protein [Oscillospiraceae bacterium]